MEQCDNIVTDFMDGNEDAAAVGVTIAMTFLPKGLPEGKREGAVEGERRTLGRCGIACAAHRAPHRGCGILCAALERPATSAASRCGFATAVSWRSSKKSKKS